MTSDNAVLPKGGWVSKALTDHIVDVCLRDIPSGSKRASDYTDMEGRRVGRWNVLGLPLKQSGRSAVSWLCLCDCGTIRYVGGEKLRQEATRSCGCISGLDWTDVRLGKWKFLLPMRNPDDELVWSVVSEDQPDAWFLFPGRKKLNIFSVHPADGPKDEWREACSCRDIITNDDGDKWVAGITFPEDMKIYINKTTRHFVVAHPSSLDGLRDCSISRSIDLSGQTRTPWYIDKRVGKNVYGQAVWKCHCINCGNVSELSTMFLSEKHATRAVCKACGARGGAVEKT